MKGLLKWFLAAAVVVAVLTMLGTPAAEAARWRVYAYGYPAYYGPPAYHYYDGPYYYGPRWAPPVPPVAVYRAPVVVPRPVVVRPVYRPLYVPYRVRYWAW